MAKRKQAARGKSTPSDNESEVDALQTRKKVRWNGRNETTSLSDSEELEETTKRVIYLGLSEDDECLDLFWNQTAMAVCCLHGKIGAAYYDSVTHIIFVLEDTQESQYFDLIKMLLEQVNPDTLLTSSRSDELFIDVLQNHCEASGSNFHIRPYKEFLPSNGRERLMSLNLLTEFPDPSTSGSPRSATEFSAPRGASTFMERREALSDPLLKHWHASIRVANFSPGDTCLQCMGSIGGLIEHLIREMAISDMDDDVASGLDVRNIEALALNEVMHVNADALLSLQVFEAESHASIHTKQTKEGLSLFGILNSTKTTMGKALLRTWILRPSLDLTVIDDRHNAVECFVNPTNSATTSSISTHLKGIKNAPRTLATMRTGKVKLSDWQVLVKLAYHGTLIRDAVCELHGAKNIPIIRKVLDALDVTVFRGVGTKVNEIIDWEESSIVERVCVKPKVDTELDERKHTYHGIDAVLSKVAEQISDNVPTAYASTLNVVYFPQLGFLICVPMRDDWKGESGIQAFEGWSFQFSSESHVYFKSNEMQDMDIHIGDLHSAIVDREIEIVQGLLTEILEDFDTLTRACDICAELDCLLSYAEASRMYNYNRPVMVEDQVIRIAQGRHPLQELVVDSFVPNDANLCYNVHECSAEDEEANFNRVLICTGANACGKSVYLKQVALIQYMAQIGCFVPAESALLGLVDKIFTRVTTRESVTTRASAFMIDLSQISFAVRNSTKRSLLLLDEFGKGTLSTDGAGLFCGVIKHFLDREEECPMILAATHFHDVFREDLLDNEKGTIDFCHMQIMFSPGRDGTVLSREDNDRDSTTTKGEELKESMVYLYRVAKGLSLESQAAHCAEIFGVPSRVVERARYVSMLCSTYEVGRLLDESMSEQETHELREAEQICRRFLAWDLADEKEDVKAKLGRVLGRSEV